MSEINDAVQIIRVGYDGLEIAIKLGSGSLELMKKTVQLLASLLHHEKTMGKTNLRGLLEKGGDIEILSFSEKDLKKFRKLAKKYGILYSTMPKANRKDKVVEVMFHSEAAPRMRMLTKKLQDAKFYKLDEYVKNGDQEYIEKLIQDFEKQKAGKQGLHAELDKQIDAKIDGLIHQVGIFAMEKQSVSVESVEKEFKVPKEQAEDVIQKLEHIGMLGKADQNGQYKVVMDREAFEKRLEKYRELTNRMKQIAASKDTNLTDITISVKMIEAENDHAVKTRVPGMYGDNVGYIWLKKEDIMEIHNGKTMLTYLDKKKEYKIYGKENQVLFTMKGEELYSKHYDKVEHAVRERYKKEKNRKPERKQGERTATKTPRRR